MSSREFAEWKAYNDLEPFGERRGDLRAARICATVAAAMGGTRCTLAEFMPDFDREPARRESAAVMQAKLRAILAPMAKAAKKGKAKRG